MNRIAATWLALMGLWVLHGCSSDPSDGAYKFQRTFVESGAPCKRQSGEDDWRCIKNIDEYKSLCRRISGITEYGMWAVLAKSDIDRFLVKNGELSSVKGEWRSLPQASGAPRSAACKAKVAHSGMYEGSIYKNRTVEGWVEVFGVSGGEVFIHRMGSYPP